MKAQDPYRRSCQLCCRKYTGTEPTCSDKCKERCVPMSLPALSQRMLTNLAKKEREGTQPDKKRVHRKGSGNW